MDDGIPAILKGADQPAWPTHFSRSPGIIRGLSDQPRSILYSCSFKEPCPSCEERVQIIMDLWIAYRFLYTVY